MSRNLLSRVWPSIAILLVGLSLVVAFATFVGMQFHNHDAGVAMSTLVGLMGGVQVGRCAAYVWIERNP